VKAKWIDEVAEILASDRFTKWFESLENARAHVKRMSEKSDELLTQVNLLEFRAELAHRKAIDTLERANALEDESAELANQAAELENASFEVVSDYEKQREATTKKWEAVGAIEVDLENENADRTRLQQKLAKVTEDYEREDKKKQLLWAEVEKLWIRSIDCNLALREKKHKAKLVRADAEALFSRHNEEAQEASKLKIETARIAQEQARAIAALVAAEDAARRDFDCTLTVDFMYWVARESNKVVYAVPLIEDATHYVVPVSPGNVYRCSPTLGIEEMVLVEREPSAKHERALSGRDTTSENG
jgi:ribulose bisphosphate carboxylase small subunit